MEARTISRTDTDVVPSMGNSGIRGTAGGDSVLRAEDIFFHRHVGLVCVVFQWPWFAEYDWGLVVPARGAS